MPRIASVLVVTFLMASALVADDDPTRTLNIINGRGWRQLKARGTAIAYLTGLYDGLNYFGQHPEFRTNLPSVGFTPLEISAGVTAFYANDPARLRLPVPLAVSMFLRHAEGDSDEQMAKRIEGAFRDLDAMLARQKTAKP